MQPGDLCEVKVDFLDRRRDFVGIYLGIVGENHPWYFFRFLHESNVQNLRLMKTEAQKYIKVLHEAR